MPTRKDEWGLTPESTVKAINKYNKERTKLISIRLNVRTDADIFYWIWGQKSVAGAIKKLIREDIARQEEAKKMGND